MIPLISCVFTNFVWNPWKLLFYVSLDNVNQSFCAPSRAHKQIYGAELHDHSHLKIPLPRFWMCHSNADAPVEWLLARLHSVYFCCKVKKFTLLLAKMFVTEQQATKLILSFATCNKPKLTTFFFYLFVFVWPCQNMQCCVKHKTDILTFVKMFLGIFGVFSSWEKTFLFIHEKWISASPRVLCCSLGTLFNISKVRRPRM